MEELQYKKYPRAGVCAALRCSNRTPYTLCGTCKSKKSRSANPLRYAFITLKNNAKRRGIAFSLTLNQFEKFCIKTKYLAGKGRHSDGYTVDRIDTTKGYHADNIQVLTLRDNVIKMHLDYNWQYKYASVHRMGGAV